MLYKVEVVRQEEGVEVDDLLLVGEWTLDTSDPAWRERVVRDLAPDLAREVAEHEESPQAAEARERMLDAYAAAFGVDHEELPGLHRRLGHLLAARGGQVRGHAQSSQLVTRMGSPPDAQGRLDAALGTLWDAVPWTTDDATDAQSRALDAVLQAHRVVILGEPPP